MLSSSSPRRTRPISTSRRSPRPRHRVEHATPADRADVAEFRSRHYAAGAPQVDDAHVRWLFDGNPSRSDTPDIWICRNDDRIVGQQCGIPVRLKVGAVSLRASWAVDLMVDPEWRMRGVAPVLSEAQAASAEAALALNVSPPAYRAYRRRGWIDLGNVPLYVRPFRTTQAVRAANVSSKTARRLAPVADQPLRAFDGVLGFGLHAAGIELRLTERFDELADELWRVLAPAYPVLVQRDLEWLRWRFDEAPNAHVSNRFYLVFRGRPLGYIVLRAEHRGGQLFSVVSDYLVRPALTGVLFALALREARKQGAVALACRTLNRRAEPWLRALAFARLTTTDVPVRFLVLPGPRTLQVPLLSDRRNWFVTAADSDLDH